MSLIIISFKQITIMAIMIIIGAICYRKKMVNHEQNHALSSMALNVVMPAVILKSYLADMSTELIINLFWAIVISIVIYAMIAIVTPILVKKKDNANYGVESLSLFYSNCSFIGIPLLHAVLGDKGVFFVTAYITFSTILFWIHGYIVMSGEGIHWASIKKSLTAPSMFSIYTGILCMIFKIHVPDMVHEVVDSIAGMNTPLAMFVAGISIAQTDLKTALKNIRTYYIVFLKLIIIPILTLLLCIPFARMSFDHTMLATLVIAAACPAAASCTMLANYCHKDERYSSEIFAMTTLFSALTLPLIISMTEFL